MEKIITASFEDPPSITPVRISLANTHGVQVGGWMQIGFDRYRIIKVDQLSVTVLRGQKFILAGTIAVWLNQ